MAYRYNAVRAGRKWSPRAVEAHVRRLRMEDLKERKNMFGLDDWIAEPKVIKRYISMRAAFKTRSATAAGYSLSRSRAFSAFALKI